MSDQTTTKQPNPATVSSATSPPTFTIASNVPTSSMWDKLEKLIKAGTIVLALVGAMGFPAVYIHFYRFGIPASFITYDQILKAGILPTGLLIIIGAYVYWAAQEWKSGKSVFRSFLFLILLLLPLFFALLFMILAGICSLVFLIILVVLQVINWSSHHLLHASVSQITIIRFSFACVFGLIITYAVAQITKPRWLEKQGRGWKFLKRVLKNVPRNPLDIDLLLWEIHVFETEYSMLSVVSTLIFLFLTFYSLKLTGYLLDLRFTSLIQHKYVLILSVGCTLFFFGANYLLDYLKKLELGQDPPAKRKAYIAAGGLLASFYLLAVFGYSYGMYSRLPQGLGGGKPAPVIVWVTNEQIPAGLRQAICPAASSDSAKVVRCDGAFLVYSNSEYLLITSRSVPPAAGTAVQKSSITAISW